MNKYLKAIVPNFMQFNSSGGEVPLPSVSGLTDDQATYRFLEYLTHIPETDEILLSLGKTRTDLRPLLYDDEIETAMETRLAAVMSTPLRLEPAEGANYDFLNKQLMQHAPSLIEGSFTANYFGYAVIELVYELLENNKKAVCRAEMKPFEWFRPTFDGKLFLQPAANVKTFTDEELNTSVKFILTQRKPTYIQPMGEAVLSRLYWPWFFRNNGWSFWARFLERFGSPILIGATAGDTAKLSEALASAVQAAAIAVDSGTEVTSVSPKSDGNSFVNFTIAVDKRIQKVILGQTLTSDTQGVGSQALGNVHNEVRQDRKMSDLRMIRPTLQKFIDAIRIVNRISEPYTVVMEDGTGLETNRAERDKTLVGAGIVKLTEEYILDRYDYNKGDFTIPSEGTPPVDDNGDDDDGDDLFTSRQETHLFSSSSEERIEGLVSSSVNRSVQPIDPSILRGIITSAKDPADLISQLNGQISKDLPSDQYRELVERALFAADIQGFVDAGEE